MIFYTLHKRTVIILANLFWERFYNMCTQHNTKPNPVAKEINISSGIVSKWKTVGTLPNGETLIKLAEYFNCSVDYLLGRDWGFNISGLSNTEKEIIDKFRSLSDEGRDYILKTLDIASYKYNKMPDEMVAYDVEDTVIEEYKPKMPETTAD